MPLKVLLKHRKPATKVEREPSQEGFFFIFKEQTDFGVSEVYPK